MASWGNGQPKNLAKLRHLSHRNKEVCDIWGRLSLEHFGDIKAKKMILNMFFGKAS
jgi:hypothetical protein